MMEAFAKLQKTCYFKILWTNVVFSLVLTFSETSAPLALRKMRIYGNFPRNLKSSVLRMLADAFIIEHHLLDSFF